MTDEEMKRLEAIAKEAERRNLLTGETFPEWSEFLALIERVRKAEAWQDNAVRLLAKGDGYVSDFVWVEKHRREKEQAP